MKSRLLLKFCCMAVAGLISLPQLVHATVDGSVKAEAEQGVMVKKIMLTGASSISKSEFEPILKRYEGKSQGFSDIQAATQAITELYRKKGFILAKAYLPEQTVSNGVLEIAVLEGRIGEIRIQGAHKYYSDDFIMKHFEPVKSGPLNQEKLERALLVLNEYPKLKVSTTLEAGKAPGTTDIVVTAENSIPVQLTIDYNNFGSKFVSQSRFGASLDVGNVLKEGSLMSLRANIGDNPEKMFFGRASYSLPLNALGTRLGAYYAAGDFDVGKQFEVLDIKGSSESFGFFVVHPFVKTRLRTVSAELGFDLKNADLTMLSKSPDPNVPGSFEDKIRLIRAGVNYEMIDSTGRTYFSAGIAQGLGEAFGAMADDSLIASRGGADNNFTKLNVDILRFQKIVPSLYLVLKGSGQWASESLVAMEQFSIGGADSVRGYPQAEAQGDRGYALTAELRVSPLKNKELLQFAFFLDNGWVSTIHPDTQRRKHESLTGTGAGIRLELPYSINIRGDIGVPIWPDVSSESSDEHEPRLYIQAVKKF